MKGTEEPSETPRRFAGLRTEPVLGLEAAVATTFASRLLGLALLDRADAPPALLIPRCRSVHTFGMRFELDLIFLNGGGRVVELRRAVGPGRVARCAGAESVLELPSPSEAPPSFCAGGASLGAAKADAVRPARGESSGARGLIRACSPRSTSWRRWWSAMTTSPRESCSAIT